MCNAAAACFEIKFSAEEFRALVLFMIYWNTV